MTNSWTDIKNADVVLVMGSNTAENHPMGFKFVQQAKATGGKLINVDPRFCRSSSQADIHAYMRSGTDIAFIGGMIKYAIDHGLYNEKYVKECTNALCKVDTTFKTCAEAPKGGFSGLSGGTYNATLGAWLDCAYNKLTWDYQYNPTTFTMTADANAYLYVDLTSITDYTIQSGDYLEYDVYWFSSDSKIAFDFTCTDATSLRASGAVDQNAYSAHPVTDISAQADNKWYHRKIAIPGGLVGKTICNYDIACENDDGDVCQAYITNIKITNGSGTVRKNIFSAGDALPTNSIHLENPSGQTYTIATYGCGTISASKMATDLNDPDCVFQTLKTQFNDYTISNVCALTGTDPTVYEQICQTYCGTYPDDKSATILYAMGTTQHTVGTQNIRAYSILQLLLGNIGVAGGGINALRGQDNVQGATDQAVLQHLLPGYLKVPTPAQSTLALYNAANYNIVQKIQPTVSYTIRGATNQNPPSAHWWNNGTKYISSLLKAWWPTLTAANSYTYLSRKTADYTILSMFDAMYNNQIRGAIFDGENPAVSDPASDHVREALGHLNWLVCIDPYEQETAAFWKRPGVDPADISTTVYLLPAAVALEKYGSRSDSGRWQQWHWKGGNPPGQAKSDMEILTILGQKIQVLYNAGGVSPDPIKKLSWPCLKYAGETDDALAELIAKEMHGYIMQDLDLDGIRETPGTLVGNFTNLINSSVDDSLGATACGNWLSSGSFAATLDAFEGNATYTNLIWPGGVGVGNRMKRRYPADVGQLGWGKVAGVTDYMKIGLYSYWSWCWPINRRIVYNRAATYQSDGGSQGDGLAGSPLAPSKYVIKAEYSGSTFVTWRGDQWDGGAAPGNCMPYIMNKDGYGHLFGGWTVAEGPFPWHYEPAESPISYPSWLGPYRMNPMVHFYPGSAFATHGGTEYNIFATSYRLTEHWHTGAMTRNLPRANQLQPEPFVEMSEELAVDTDAIPTGPIANGDLVRVTSARGFIEVKACVTKRLRPLNGVHQVGVIWHWGYMGLSKGDSGNVLTPFIGDANTRIPESKCFMVKIEKV